MGVFAEFTVGEDQFPLGAVLSEASDMTLELDRIGSVTSSGVPYLWATGEDHDEFVRTVLEGPLIDSITAIDRLGDSVLYRIDWAEEIESLVQRIAESGVRILEATRVDRHWVFRLRFDSHDDLSTFTDYCSERAIEYHLTRIYPDSDSQSRLEAYGLSEAQLDTLVFAVEKGYFEVPRGITLGEVGEEFGITQQAASERVRRGANEVLRSILLSPDDR